MDIYLNVITAQTALLNNQRTALNLQMEQLTASVQLIKALGGGWDASLKQPPEYAPLAAFFTAPHSALRICARLHRRVFEQPRFSPAG
jgi:hypothetical protein